MNGSQIWQTRKTDIAIIFVVVYMCLCVVYACVGLCGHVHMCVDGCVAYVCVDSCGYTCV